MVPIPWRQEKVNLGNSYRKAVQFYLGQEKRWRTNGDHKLKSDEFLNEYLILGHMSKAPTELQGGTTGKVYYIPHLSVIRQETSTTKLRNANAALNNASSPTSSGVSLNEISYRGLKRGKSSTFSQEYVGLNMAILMTSLRWSDRYY